MLNFNIDNKVWNGSRYGCKTLPPGGAAYLGSTGRLLKYFTGYSS
jgi:hypothetical protein